jgi:hypothetical protein
VLSFVSPQCHLVSTFTRVRTFTFSTHHSQSTTRAERMCSAPGRGVRDVRRTRAGVTDITLWGLPHGDDSHYCVALCRPLQRKRSKRWGRWNIVGPYVSYGLFQTTRETCAKFGSDRFINVNLYKVQTNIQTFIFIYKIHTHTHIYIHGVPGGICQTSGECSLCYCTPI